MLGGAPPTICRSGRSTCSTIRCCERPLAAATHIKPRLLGHWGTTPGLNFIYVHLNRVIKARDLDMIYICGPGHGGPGMVANTWLEGTYSELYPTFRRTREGMRGCSGSSAFPAASRAMPRPRRPGSIHEGGELGYSLSHAYRRGVRQSRT